MEYPLEAGSYTFAELQPRVTFTVGDGWVAYRDSRDAAGLFLNDETSSGGPPSESLGGIDFARVQVVFSGPCIDDGTELLASEPAAVIDWLASHPSLAKVGDVMPVNAGGFSGLSIQVSSKEDTCESDGPGVFLFPVGDDLFRMRPGEVARITTLDVVGRPFSLIVSAGDRSAEFFPIADQVLGTLTLEP